MYSLTQLIGACLMTAAVFQVVGMLVGARWEAWRAEKTRQFRREKSAFYAALDPHDPAYLEDKNLPLFLKRQGE